MRSCGLYFEPQRLALRPEAWRGYWQARQAPAWLLDLERLQPQTRVPVKELLEQLQQLPAQGEARRVLLDVALQAGDGHAVASLGGRLRVKTWSWLDDHDPQARQGGFAGWLVDGTPLWLGGPGTSKMILDRYAEVLGRFLPSPWPADPGRCVEVNLFSRYPLRSVSDPPATRPPKACCMVRSKCSSPTAIDWTSPAPATSSCNGWMACRAWSRGFRAKSTWRGCWSAKPRRSRRKPLARWR